MGDVTRLLHAVEQGDPQAAEKLLPLSYEELRRLATHKMANEPAGHTVERTDGEHFSQTRRYICRALRAGTKSAFHPCP